MRSHRSLLGLFALLPFALALTASGCSGSDETKSSSTTGGTTTPTDPDCDPLVPTFCGFPFPSNYYLKDDATKKTGKHVEMGKHALPRTFDQSQPPDPWFDSDGFSPGATILTDLPGATITGLPTQDTLEKSITKDSPTILLNAETGELVPHFAELDMSSVASDEERTFMIRPVVRLDDATRYIVAIRHVVDASGKELPPSPAFQALRDGGPTHEPTVEARRALYDDIFTKLEKAGIEKKDLQLAWDYSTASRENNTQWFLHMRDEALATVGDEGPEYVIDSIEEDPNPHIKRRIHGRMTVPLYLDKAEEGGTLVFGDDGMPKQNGTAQFEFLVHVPNSLVNDGKAGPLVQNGHGLLGAKTEGQNGYLAQFADDYGYVAFAVDFVGMAGDDQSQVADAISTGFGNFKQIVGRQHQGLLNSLLAMRMMKGRFFKDPAVTFNGKSVIDPTQCYYRGDSQGGIFGTTYMAVSTDVTRGLLGEPGMPYNLLLNRSLDFAPFFTLFRLGLGESSHKIQLALGLVQMLWDRTEPDGYAPYIHENTLPNTPPHDILIHDALGDKQVTPLGAHMIARAVGAREVEPALRPLFGIPVAKPPFSGSAIMEFSFGLPDAPKTNVPPPESDGEDPHDKVRVLKAAMSQSDVFFRTGEITTTCDGVCDPE